jgi:transcriptional antiterminator NusG
MSEVPVSEETPAPQAADAADVPETADGPDVGSTADADGPDVGSTADADADAPDAPDAATDTLDADAPDAATDTLEAAADEVEAAGLVVDEAASGAAEYEYVQEGEGEEAEPEKKVESPYDRPGRWYAVHTQSGYEKKAKQNLQARINSLHQEDTIYEVIIPMEDVVEFKAGKKVVVQKKMLPGYMLVRCKLDDDAWRTIRDTPGITGFVGPGNKPAPLTRKDVEGFMAVEVDGEEPATKRSKPRFEFELHESVRVTDGPFADFTGEIVEINEDQLKVKVLVNIFGRETPVELEFSQIAKL